MSSPVQPTYFLLSIVVPRSEEKWFMYCVCPFRTFSERSSVVLARFRSRAKIEVFTEPPIKSHLQYTLGEERVVAVDDGDPPVRQLFETFFWWFLSLFGEPRKTGAFAELTNTALFTPVAASPPTAS